MKNSYKIMILILVIAIIGLILFTFSNNNGTQTAANTNSSASTSSSTSSTSTSSTSTSTVTVNGAIYKKADEFSERDLAGTYDESDSTKYTLADNTDITIKEEGIYIVSGNASNVTIYVEALDTAKVQIVLNNASITNQSKPAIYVKTADKVFVTLIGENTLKVMSKYEQMDKESTLDGVIFSKQDLTLNGSGTLNIESTVNGVVGKDDLKITGGTYNIIASTKCFEANDSIRIAGGTFNLTAGTDGLHSENDDDNSKGYIYITGGEFNIKAGDDAIHATTVVQIDDGTLNITAAEGIEGTYIQINNGTITISASDDGINAAKKSTSYTPTVEINDGNIKITMGQGDTDGIDSNGNIIMNGGTVDITGQSTTDYDGTATKNGGTLIINGTETDTFLNQFGGGMPGGQMQGGRRNF